MKIHCIRLNPGEDLKKSLNDFVKAHEIKAGAILTCVGSVSSVHLRLAGAKSSLEKKGKHEIISLVGTLSVNGSHIHMGLSDENGNTCGGHLMNGNLINTTAEIVIGELIGFEFSREPDDNTGYDELSIRSIQSRQ